MFTGFSATNYSGSLLGTHQRLNRMSRKVLNSMLIDNKAFPSARQINHFEGKNGPDGLKVKSAGRNEPWHYYDPYDPDDGEILRIIEEHHKNLVREIKDKNMARVAFEAAWMSHALLDGLTPSHHYPLEKELENIRGESLSTRNTKIKKIIITSDKKSEFISNNWKTWGAKGLLTTHYLFEIGAAAAMVPLGNVSYPSKYDIKSIKRLGLIEFYKRLAREVAEFDIYGRFYKTGWTPSIIKLVKRELAPRMGSITTLGWYLAALEAEIAYTEV
jgi:hypothetical protein